MLSYNTLKDVLTYRRMLMTFLTPDQNTVKSLLNIKTAGNTPQTLDKAPNTLEAHATDEHNYGRNLLGAKPP